MLFIDQMVNHLLRSPECCSPTYCFYLLTFFSKLSDTSLSASETRFFQDSFALFHSLRSHSTFHPRKHLLCGQHEFAETCAPAAGLGEHQGVETLQQFSLSNKTIFLEITCSPGDLSHFFWLFWFFKAHCYHADLMRNCLLKNVEMGVGVQSPSLMT